jgi:hypothetical protein
MVSLHSEVGTKLILIRHEKYGNIIYFMKCQGTKIITKLHSIGFRNYDTNHIYWKFRHYVEDFLYIVVHLFCYIVHWDGLLLEKPETNYNLFAHKNWLLRQKHRYIYTKLETAIKANEVKISDSRDNNLST